MQLISGNDTTIVFQQTSAFNLATSRAVGDGLHGIQYALSRGAPSKPPLISAQMTIHDNDQHVHVVA